MDDHKPRLELSSPVKALKGIGPNRAVELARGGVRTIEDLLFSFPIRYEDRRSVRPIYSLREGETVQISGRVVSSERVSTSRRGFTIYAAALQDGSGGIQCVWFNQPWVLDKLKQGSIVTLYGPVEKSRDGRRLQISNAEIQVGDAVAAGIVPVYQKVRGVGGRIIRSAIMDVLDRYDVPLESAVPASIRRRLELMDPAVALRRLHQPPEDVDLATLNTVRDPAHRSLVFDEFFCLQAGLALRKSAHGAEEIGITFETSPAMRETLKQMLPFRLTDGQRQAFREIVEDMTSPAPMRRLLQGDVGCGKTIVALLTAALAMENGYQAAFMAPTEILAEQHLARVRQHLAHTRYRVGFLSGSLPAKERNAVRAALAAGEIDLVVGTHALIQEGVTFKKLGLAVIDEQHRFGVLQRAKLLEQAGGVNPDLLIMTATPIPRSLTLTLFGDLAVSVIRDMPPGRTPVRTAVRSEANRTRINLFLRDQMRAGRQVYCVAPAIDEDREGELATVTELYERLRATFPDFTIGMLHGRMKRADRELVMGEFVAGRMRMLASTTVIEVGVDVSNATVMVIENAERFGLSQLHQLRGRVGRGAHQSWCILIGPPRAGDAARERLKIMEQTGDGFVIAEKDLELRGPGDFLGTRQSGVPGMRIGNIVRDMGLLQQARAEAFAFIEDETPARRSERQTAIKRLRAIWQKRYGLVLIG